MCGLQHVQKISERGDRGRRDKTTRLLHQAGDGRESICPLRGVILFRGPERRNSAWELAWAQFGFGTGLGQFVGLGRGLGILVLPWRSSGLFPFKAFFTWLFLQGVSPICDRSTPLPHEQITPQKIGNNQLFSWHVAIRSVTGETT